MALTPEQENILLTFKQIKEDIKALKDRDREVATYAEMIAIGTVKVITNITVVADEKRQDNYTVYKLYPSGKRLFILSLEDN